MFVAIWLTSWISYARITRGETLVAKRQEYALAARALGYTHRRVMLRHVLPNVVSLVIIFAMVDAVGNVALGASLGFLGLGAQPPSPEWGVMISDGQNYLLSAWWLSTLPGVRDPGVESDSASSATDWPTSSAPVSDAPDAVLEVSDLHTFIATGGGVVRAVDGVSFALREREILGLVGETGCGKSVTCRTIAGLMPSPPARSTGDVRLAGYGERNVLDLSPRELQQMRGTHLSMIFQDPMSALNPVMRVGDQIEEAVGAHQRIGGRECHTRAIELLERVGIPRAGAADARLPAPVQRRHAPARADRDRARVAAQGAARRRADDRPRRH